MKNILLVLLIFVTVNSIHAQIEIPKQSPLSKIEQTVGLSKITIEYSRPSVKGRKIIGDILNVGTIWRTGANKNTTVTFSHDVVLSGKPIKSGSYAIFTKLISEKEWEVIFYADTENWGVPKNLDETKVAAAVRVDVKQMPMAFETLLIDVNEISNEGATINLLWGNYMISIPFTVPTEKIVSDVIDKVMSGPTANDYYSAAVYYLEIGKDIKQAKVWMDKAISMIEEPSYWQLRQFALVYAKAGDKNGAIEFAKKSLEAAKKADNSNYIKLNTESLKEWGVK